MRRQERALKFDALLCGRSKGYLSFELSADIACNF